jgi:hypothetical protein
MWRVSVDGTARGQFGESRQPEAGVTASLLRPNPETRPRFTIRFAKLRNLSFRAKRGTLRHRAPLAHESAFSFFTVKH